MGDPYSSENEFWGLRELFADPDEPGGTSCAFSLNPTTELAKESMETNPSDRREDSSRKTKRKKRKKWNWESDEPESLAYKIAIFSNLFGFNIRQCAGFEETLLQSRNQEENVINIVLTHIISRSQSMSYQEAEVFLDLAHNKPRDWNEQLNNIQSAFSKDNSLPLTLMYLIDTYQRIQDEFDDPRSKIPCHLWFEMEIRVMNQIALLLTNVHSNRVSDANDKPTGSALLPFLYYNYPPGLVSKLARELYKRDGIAGDFKLIFVPLLEEIRVDMKRDCTLAADDHIVPLAALARLCEIGIGKEHPICQLLVKSESWIDSKLEETDVNGHDLQEWSYLGPFLGLSSFAIDDEYKLADKLFGQTPPTNNDEENYKQNQTYIQNELSLICRQLHFIIRSFMRDEKTQPAILKYISQAIKFGESRLEIKIDDKKEVSDGFILNLMSVLQTLTENVRIEGVDLTYPFHQDALVTIRPSDERMKMTKEEAEKFDCCQNLKDSGHKKISSFNTHLFFLALECHHIGIATLIKKSTNRKEVLDSFNNGSAELQFLAPDQIEQLRIIMHKSKCCTDMSIKGEKMIEKCIKFYTKQLKLVAQSVGGANNLPLPEMVPRIFSALPQWYLEDVIEFFLFVIYNESSVVSTEPPEELEELIGILILFFCSPNYFSNHRIGMMIVDVMALSAITEGELFNQNIALHPLSQDHLANGLLRYYTHVETSDDRFTIRTHLWAIIQVIWESSVHRIAMKDPKNSNSFLRFGNTLVSDATYALDKFCKLVDSLVEFHTFKNNKVQWEALDDEAKEAKEAEDQSRRDFIPHGQLLADETLSILEFAVMRNPEPFKRSELLVTLVLMMNKNLCRINGLIPFALADADLDGERLRRWVKILVNIYINFQCEEFQKVIANDETFYNMDTFNEAFSRVPIDEDERELFQQLWRKMIESVEAIQFQIATTPRIDYSDAPEEFLCLMMATLMDNPVFLPSAKVWVDQSSILHHLLNDERDPYTRDPLTKDDIVVDLEFKKRIDEWKETKETKKQE